MTTAAPGGFLKIRGSSVETETAPFAHDEDAARQLFQELEQITATRYPL
jgi:hypothetical protein